MLQDRYILAEKLDQWFDNHGGDTAYVQSLVEKLYDKYNLPIDLSIDIIAGRKPLAACNDLICYWLTAETRPELVPKFYTKAEIKNYSTARYESEQPILPLELQALQLAPDQWLATITVEKMMELRKHSLLHYNAETQRALKMLVKGEEVVYIPYTNRKAVREMRTLMSDGMFIANVLTFNVNADDADADISYRNGILRIDNISAFDIVDGYNRFKAYESTYDENPNYNFTTGLMITRFSVNKAKQFIFQENHHTNMKQVDVDALSRNNNYNAMLERINMDSTCNLKGEINSGTGHVRFGIAARALTIGFNKKDFSQRDIISNTPVLIEKLNKITETKTELLDRQWLDYEVCIIFFTICWCSPDTTLRILDDFTTNEIAQHNFSVELKSKSTRSRMERLLRQYTNVEIGGGE